LYIKNIVWVEEFGDAIYKDGKIEFIEGIFIDITERKKNETVLQQKKLAEAANKAKSEFLYESRNSNTTKWNYRLYRFINENEFRTTQEKYITTVNQSALSLILSMIS
jgi:hypothetical protein